MRAGLLVGNQPAIHCFCLTKPAVRFIELPEPKLQWRASARLGNQVFETFLGRLEGTMLGDQIREGEFRCKIVEFGLHRFSQRLLGGVDVLLQQIELSQAIPMREVCGL